MQEIRHYANKHKHQWSLALIKNMHKNEIKLFQATVVRIPDIGQCCTNEPSDLQSSALITNLHELAEKNIQSFIQPEPSSYIEYACNLKK